MDRMIRDAREDDLDALEKLEKICFSLPWPREALRASLPDALHEFLVIESEGALLGYISMMCVLDEGDIANIAVAPEARRRGLGRALLEEMLQRARARALSLVTLEVRAHNDAAIALYREAGFRPVGLRKAYYEKPREDALLMTLYFHEEETERV